MLVNGMIELADATPKNERIRITPIGMTYILESQDRRKLVSYGILDDCSIVTAPYQLDDDTVGVLGVIGPTRMAYDRVVPIVDITARLLRSALGQ